MFPKPPYTHKTRNPEAYSRVAQPSVEFALRDRTLQTGENGISRVIYWVHIGMMEKKMETLGPLIGLYRG